MLGAGGSRLKSTQVTSVFAEWAKQKRCCAAHSLNQTTANKLTYNQQVTVSVTPTKPLIAHCLFK
jgi:hypothetical protein